MDRWVTPTKRVTSPTCPPPPPHLHVNYPGSLLMKNKSGEFGFKTQVLGANFNPEKFHTKE